jgi:TetR/AcrR family transcriptional repressor of nem operon
MNLGRPLEFDPEQALDTAMREFWLRGYEATSMQALLAAMGLSKSSLYQTFGSKQALFERCLDRYRDVLAAALDERLQSSPSARRFIEDTLNAVAAEAAGPHPPAGCLMMNTAAEFGQRDGRVADCVARGTSRIEEVLLRAVQQAQAAGEIPTHRDARALASFLLTTTAGLHTLVKAGADQQTARRVAAVVMTALD